MSAQQSHIEHSATHKSVHRERRASLVTHKHKQPTRESPHQSRHAHAKHNSSRVAGRPHHESDGNLHLGKGDLLSLLHALEIERLNAAPWQVTSLKHTLDALTEIAQSRLKRGRS